MKMKDISFHVVPCLSLTVFCVVDSSFCLLSLYIYGLKIGTLQILTLHMV